MEPLNSLRQAATETAEKATRQEAHESECVPRITENAARPAHETRFMTHGSDRDREATKPFNNSERPRKSLPEAFRDVAGSNIDCLVGLCSMYSHKGRWTKRYRSLVDIIEALPELDVVEPKISVRRTPLTAIEIREAIRLYRSGQSIRLVAEQLGGTPTQVRLQLIKHDVPRRGR